VKITTLPTNGFLKLNGVNVNTGDFIGINGNGTIAGGPLTFIPVANGFSNPTATTPFTSFQFQVKDNGGTQNNGVDLDPNPKVLTITVTPVNDAPIGTPTTALGVEDHSYTLVATDFGFTDPTDNPQPNLLSAVTIASPLPANGTLTLSGQPVFAANSSSRRARTTTGRSMPASRSRYRTTA
jgi:Bacterial cadherin-like domain